MSKQQTEHAGSAKHTPGPWLVEHETDITGWEASPDIGCVGKVDVAHVYLRAVLGKTEANARLIAAAPELLAALQHLRDAFIGTSIEVQADAMRNARAAIAKATGVKA